jgi:pilus assembly protein Flp/PilA
MASRTRPVAAPRGETIAQMAEPDRDGSNRTAVSRAVALARRFAGDAHGATAIEYAMIGGLIFAVAAGSIRLYGTRASSVYGQIGNAMAQIN